MVPATISPRCQTDHELMMNLTGLSFSGLFHELHQQAVNLLRLLLLHPVAGAVDQVTAEHAGAGRCLHCLIDAGTLICAPVLPARNKARGHVEAAAGIGFEFGSERARGAAAIPLQPALESGAVKFG